MYVGSLNQIRFEFTPIEHKSGRNRRIYHFLAQRATGDVTDDSTASHQMALLSSSFAPNIICRSEIKARPSHHSAAVKREGGRRATPTRFERD